MARLNYLQNTDEYALILSKEAVETLWVIGNQIGGVPEKSRRRYADEVVIAIRNAHFEEITYDNSDIDTKLGFSAIWFNNTDAQP